MTHGSWLRTHLLVALCLASISLVACASPPSAHAEAYQYFATPAPTDPWSPKIAGWQVREKSARRGLPASMPRVDAPGADLRTKFARLQRAALDESQVRSARELAISIQRLAPDHYVADGAIDHWATLEDTLARNGDDCDGLELLTYHGLRAMGFGDDRVFRAIVYRPDDGQHHMVTLWFDSPDDPFVLDPTGAMTKGMPRMSDVPEWVPLKVFSETNEFSVRPTVSVASH